MLLLLPFSLLSLLLVVLLSVKDLLVWVLAFSKQYTRNQRRIKHYHLCFCFEEPSNLFSIVLFLVCLISFLFVLSINKQKNESLKINLNDLVECDSRRSKKSREIYQIRLSSKECLVTIILGAIIECICIGEEHKAFDLNLAN